jgi:putative sigma-54 modulation protein
MNIKIHGGNFTITESIKDYIDKRIGKLSYFETHINEINFYLKSEKILFTVNSTLSIAKFAVYKFETTAGDIYSAIDKIIHIMDIKLSKEKNKIQDHSNLGHQDVVNYFSDHEEDKHAQVKHVSLYTKPLTLIDAYLQMQCDESKHFGFNLIVEDENFSPAFLRKDEKSKIYFYKMSKPESFVECLLTVKGKSVKEDKKTKKYELKEMDLYEAQSAIMDEKDKYKIYIDSNNKKINFLLQESKGKWELIS